MNFFDMYEDENENELLNAFKNIEDDEDSTETQPFFNDSTFDFNDYIDESQYKDASTADSVHEPQKSNDRFDTMNSHENSTVLADSTNEPGVATQIVTSKDETANVSGSTSSTAPLQTSMPQGLRINTAVSNPINNSDLNRPISSPEQPATFDGQSTNSNAVIDHEISNPGISAEHRSEEAGFVNPVVNEHNDSTSFGDNTNQQSLQEGEAPIDLNFSFDGLFDSDDWNADAVDTSGWNLNDWGIEDRAQGSLPLTDNLGSPSAQANLAHQLNAEPFFNVMDNSVSSAPGTINEPNVYGVLPNINTQEEEQVSVEQSRSSISQSFHQHPTPQTSQANVMTTAVSQNVGANARGIAQQYTTQQPMKSSQTVATQAGTVAGSSKQQVNGNNRMPVQPTGNNHRQQPTQRIVAGAVANAHLQNINGHAHSHNINGHMLPVGQIQNNINGHTLPMGQIPNNSNFQQRSKSLPTSDGSSKEEAIDLISPVAATFNDEHATSHAPSGSAPSISRQPVNNSHTFSGPNSHGSLHSQRSPGSMHQRQLQQMTPRSQSNLRHVSVPAQSMGQSQASTGTGYQVLSNQMDSSVVRPSIETYQQLGLGATNGGSHSFSQGYGSNQVAERILSGYGDTFTGPKVNDLRAQSLSNDATSSQHRLSHSPRSNLGNHRVLTQAVFQSPQQRQFSLLNQPHALALQHLLPLQGVPRTSVLPNSLGLGHTNNSMKHETSSPESASGTLNKIKQVPQHDSPNGRRNSQVSNFQTPNIDFNLDKYNTQDQQRIILMYNAMLDMSEPHDNEGMLKTWRGLMKEKAKILQVCIEVLVRCPS